MQRPARNYRKTLVSMARNSIGANTYRNLWVCTDEKGEFDSLDDGENSCAFFVSSLLVALGKIHAAHGTVVSTEKDLSASGWIKVTEPQAGDVVLWGPKLQNPDGPNSHIGFYIGDGMCISNRWQDKSPQEHMLDYDSERAIVCYYRPEDWSDESLLKQKLS